MPPWLKPDKEENCVCMICANAEELTQEYVKLTRKLHPERKKAIKQETDSCIRKAIKQETDSFVCTVPGCADSDVMRKRCISDTPFTRDEAAAWAQCPPNATNDPYVLGMIPPCLRYTEDFKEFQRSRTFNILDYPLEGIV